eukprot:COSAG01_NODE_1786_length_9231_cov_19.575276_9_plen_320_part_00
MVNLMRSRRPVRDSTAVVGTNVSAAASTETSSRAHRRWGAVSKSVRKKKSGWDFLVSFTKQKAFPGSLLPKGRSGWDSQSQRDCRLTSYIVKHCEHHVKEAWSLDARDWDEDQEAVSWMDDYTQQQDAIPLAAAAVLGPERSTQLARRAEQQGSWWFASLRWSATALCAKESAGLTASNEYFKSCAVSQPFPSWNRSILTEIYLCHARSYQEILRTETAGQAALEKVRPMTAAKWVSKDRLELSTLMAILSQWDPKDYPIYKSRINTLLTSSVAKEDPGAEDCMRQTRPAHLTKVPCRNNIPGHPCGKVLSDVYGPRIQ